jgi:hypothetical protein
MAFMTHDEYLQTFGGALRAASTPGISPGPGQPPQLPSAFGAQQAPPPGAGPAMAPPQQQAAPPPAGPAMAPQAAPAQPAFGAAGAAPVAAPPAGGEGAQGKSVRDYLEEADEDERKEFASTVKRDFGVEDLGAAATQVASKDPELAAQYKTGPADKKWDEAEAAAFLMEFGLRMMRAGGSGQGNFLSDVGGSALDTIESRRAFKAAEAEKAERAEDRDWQRKQRERDEAKWGAQDREETRERKRRSAEEMRKQETHERAGKAADKALKAKDWKREVGEDGNVVFIDPTSGARFETDLPSRGRDSDGRISAFSEELDVWQTTAAGVNGMKWSELDSAQQAAVNRAFFEYRKSGVGTTVAKQNFIRSLIEADKKQISAAVRRNPEALAKAEAEIERRAVETADSVFPAEHGVMPRFGERPPQDASEEELIKFYTQNPEG